MSEFNRKFAEFEAEFTDPLLKESLDEVRMLNESLLMEPTTELDARQLLDTLNQQWRDRSLNIKEMFVTGDVYIGGEYDGLRYGVFNDKPAPLEQYPFITKGFGMIANMQEVEDEYRVHQEIVMLGRIEYDFGVEDGDGEKSNEACAIQLTENVTIDYREMIPSKAAAWLELYCPDTKLLIDECILQSNNEAEAMLNLRDTQLPELKGRKRENRRNLEAIQVYISSAIELEKHIPYLLELLGPCKDFNPYNTEWENKTILGVNNTLVVFNRLIADLDKETAQVQFSVEGWRLSSSKSEQVLTKIPLNTILALESGRDRLRS